MERDNPPFQDAFTHQIWNFYLKEYKRCAPDTIILKTRSNVKVQGHHTGQCKRTGGCFNELVVAFFSTGSGVKGKKSIPVDFYDLFINLYLLSPRFFKKASGILQSPPSVRPSVTLSPPKPLDEIQPSLVCECVT